MSNTFEDVQQKYQAKAAKRELNLLSYDIKIAIVQQQIEQIEKAINEAHQRAGGGIVYFEVNGRPANDVRWDVTRLERQIDSLKSEKNKAMISDEMMEEFNKTFKITGI